MPKKTSPSAPTAEDTRGARNSFTSSEGWLSRVSHQAKKASTANPSAVVPSTSQCTQEPLSPPWMMPRSEQLHIQRGVAEPGLPPGEEGQHGESQRGGAEHVPVHPGALVAALDDAEIGTASHPARGG